MYLSDTAKERGNKKNHAKATLAPLWIVAPEVMAGQKEAVIFDFVDLTEPQITQYLEKHSKIKQICTFENGKVQKYEQKCFGKLVLASKRLQTSTEDYAQAWLTEITNKGIECLPKDAKVESLLLRTEFVEQQNGTDNQISLNERLRTTASEWLIPFMSGKTQLTAETVYDALYWYLNGTETDKLAPETITLENGRRVKV